MSDQDHTPEERELVEAMAAIWHDVMSAGDKSIALTVLRPDYQDSNVTTTSGSPNDRFWSLMVRLGWAVEAPEAVAHLPEELNVLAFKMTDKGKSMLPQFIQAVT